MRFDRHRLVWIDPQRWPAILAAHGLANAPALLADWARDDRPLIARRPVVGELPCLVPLGLPLPPSVGKQRLAFAVPPDAIRADDRAVREEHPDGATILEHEPIDECVGAHRQIRAATGGPQHGLG